MICSELHAQGSWLGTIASHGEEAGLYKEPVQSELYCSKRSKTEAKSQQGGLSFPANIVRQTLGRPSFTLLGGYSRGSSNSGSSSAAVVTTPPHRTSSRPRRLLCRWLTSSHITTKTLFIKNKNSPSLFTSSTAPQHQHNYTGGLDIVTREVVTPQEHTHARTHVMVPAVSLRPRGKRSSSSPAPT